MELSTDFRSDIYMNNLAYKIPEFDSWPLAQVYECLGSPIKQVVNRYDDSPLGPEAPSYVVVPAHLSRLGKPPEGNVTILDFGGASFAAEPRKHCCTPIGSQAPEALLGESAGQPADIWAFACTVFALFDNQAIFDVGMPNADEILAEIVDTLGRLPEPWWQKWKYRWEFYEEDGEKKTENLGEEYIEVRPLAVRIKRMRSSPPAAKEGEQLGEEDLAGLQELLECCFRYKPEERVTAEEILKLGWVRKLSVDIWNAPQKSN